MSTQVSPTTSDIAHLDWKPMCDRREVTTSEDICGKDASYLCIRVCGCGLFRCDGCLRNALASTMPVGVCSKCGDCRRRSAPGSNYVQIIPLGGTR